MAKNTAHYPAIFLMGPTAAGKTALAISLRQHLPVELVSVDSVLIYRGMDIGTAKPSSRELAEAPHRLINIRDPFQVYSVADFISDALKEMADITASGRVPLLVGGAMLYYKMLLVGLSSLPPSNKSVRERIAQEAIEQGWNAIHRKLKEIDPVAALRIHPNDPQRLSRALEVFLISGKTLTELTKLPCQSLPYNVYQFVLAPPNSALIHHRIQDRYHQMLDSGFEAEVCALFARDDLHRDLPSMRSVGYRQMWSYLSGEISYDEMVYRGICATCQLAKRQMTWLRGWNLVHWLDSEKPAEALNAVLQVIKL